MGQARWAGQVGQAGTPIDHPATLLPHTVRIHRWHTLQRAMVIYDDGAVTESTPVSTMQLHEADKPDVGAVEQLLLGHVTR